MSFYETDPEGKLVPVREEIPEEAIRLMDRMDDTAIIQRLTTGIASEAFIYRYPIKTAAGTKEIIGISADGADEIALRRGNIEILPNVAVDKDSDPDYYYAMVRGKDLVSNVILLGVGRQCKYQVGRGNQPDHDRMDEHAFVKSITKAQRNVILHLTPQEIIIGILNRWSQSGKSKQLRPPVVDTEKAPPSKATTPTHAPPVVVTPSPTATTTPTTGIAPQQIAEQVEKLKKLRMEVHNRFQTDLGIGIDKRKAMLVERFGVGSLTDLSEQQLKECKAWVEEMICQRTVEPLAKIAVEPAMESLQPALPAPDEPVGGLGFVSPDEQAQLKGRLYTILTSPSQLNLKPEEAKQFLTDRNYASTAEIHKDKFLELIQEANGLVKAKQTPTEF